MTVCIIAFIALLTLMSAEMANADYVVDHLYSYYNWTGDSGSTVVDSSGNGHHGMNSGSILNNGPVANRTFDGTDAITLPQQPVAGWKGFTYETIILPTNVTQGTRHGIMGQSYGRNALYLDGAKLVIRIVNAGGYAVEARSGNISTDKPIHVVMTYNNTTKYARLYINGIYVTQVLLSIGGNYGRIWQTFPGSSIANSYIAGMGKFEGSIQYFRVYDSNLSDAQVQQNYLAEQWRLAPVQAPVASFTSNTTSGAAPLTVQFWDNSTGSPTAWQWQWGDSTANDTTRNPVHTYMTPGTYTINLTTSNTGGSTTIQRTGYITVIAPMLPVASFSANVTSGSVPLCIQFWDNSTNATNWQWQWGDGTANDTTRNPVHTYTSAGIYSVNLTVTNAYGSNGFQRAGYINVTSKPGDGNSSYMADHLYSYYNWTGDSGSTVVDSSGNGHHGNDSGSVLNNGPIATRTFDGAAKMDIPHQPVIGWNGFTYETIILPTNVTPRTTHGIVGQGYGYNSIYLDGAKLVIRIVNAGGYAVEARSGNISIDKPTHVVMTYNNTTKYARLYINGTYVTQVQLSSAGSRGQVWKVFNEFLPSIGDRYIYVTGMGKFEGTMWYLRVYDTSLSDAQVQQNYLAEQWRLAPVQKPVANFTSNMTSGIAPLTVQFWDNSTGSPAAWQWQWGDGTANDTTRSPVHTYTTPGTYTINLTTSNAYGSSAIQRNAYIIATTPTGNGLVLNNSFVKGAYSIINTHAHTNKSDGEYDPSTLIQQYRDLGFSAAAITDHWGITSDPFIPGITFLQGTEWSTEPGHPPVPYQHGDIIILSTNFYNGMVRAYNTSSNYYHYWSDVREFKDKYNGILIYCHPDSSNSWNYSTIASAAKDFDIVEVQNDGVTQDIITKVDPWLNQGNRMWLVSGSDAHHSASLYNWDIVNSNDNSNSSIIEAMKAGNYIAYYGWEYKGQPFVEDIRVSGMNIMICLTAESTITWIGEGGMTLKTETARNGTYTASGTENYIRAYVRYNGGALQAWTQPIYVEPAGPIVKFDTSTYIPSYYLRNANGNLCVQIIKMGTGACYVNYTTVNGTALAGVNYAATSGQLVFGASETKKTIEVPISYSPTGSGGVFYLNITSSDASYGNVRNATVAIQ